MITHEHQIGHDGRAIGVDECGDLVLTIPVVHGKLEIWFGCEEQRDLVDALREYKVIK